MNRRARVALLPAIALASAFALAATLYLGTALMTSTPPSDAPGMAQWLLHHPADWLVAARLTEVALDGREPGRVAAWRALYAHAKHLAPSRTNADAAFVRAGLFHWVELNPADHQKVIEACAPLFRDPAVFDEMYAPLWELTRDLKLLRRVTPRVPGAIARLKALAADHLLIDDYRQLRAEEHRVRLEVAKKEAALRNTQEVLRLTATRLRVDDEPLVDVALTAFGGHDGRGEAIRVPDELIEYLLRHPRPSERSLVRLLDVPAHPAILRARLALQLGEYAVATQLEAAAAESADDAWIDYFLERARGAVREGRVAEATAYLNHASRGGVTAALLATAAEVARASNRPAEERTYREQLRALGPEAAEWEGTCGTDELCTTAAIDVDGSAGPLDLRLSVVQTDQLSPYVEIYVDDRLVQEAAVPSQLALSIPIPRQGRHRVELLMINPVARGGLQRRLRIS